MAAQSGIRVPAELSSAFAAAVHDAEGTRSLVFTIEGESYKHLTTVSPSGSFTDDIALLPATLPNKQTPASFAYRLDSKQGGVYEWMMVTFVPDDAGVRAKMLQASSRAGLMKALGANNFKHDWFATSINDLAPGALKMHLKHMDAPPPLTASEKALIEIKAAEAEEAKRVAMDGETAAARRKAVTGLGGKTQWQDGVADALLKAAQRSDDGWIVTLEIDSKNTAAINLLRSEACTPDELANKLPEKSPAYVFYSFPTPPPPKPVARPAAPKAASAAARNTFQATQGGARVVDTSEAPRWNDEEKKNGEDKDETAAEETKDEDAEAKEQAQEDEEPKVEALEIKEAETELEPEASPEPEVPSKGRVLFIYWCPSGSPVRFRMVYSTTVRGIQQDAIDKAGCEIVGKLETSDKSDLNGSSIREAVPTRPKHSSSLPLPTQRVFGAPAPAGASFANPASNQSLREPSAARSFTTPATAPVFGAPAPPGFGRPRPAHATSTPESNTQSTSPVTASASAASGGDADDGSQDRIRSAFDAFGPRVGGGGGGGFARPRPAGRR